MSPGAKILWILLSIIVTILTTVLGSWAGSCTSFNGAGSRPKQKKGETRQCPNCDDFEIVDGITTLTFFVIMCCDSFQHRRRVASVDNTFASCRDGFPGKIMRSDQSTEHSLSTTMDFQKLALSYIFVLLWGSSSFAAGVGQATGFKVGEVTDTSAIIWTRTTMNEKPNSPDAPMFTIEYESNQQGRQVIFKAVDYPAGADVNNVRFSAPGTDGEIRISYRAKGSSPWNMTNWYKVDPDRDFTRQFRLPDLKPDTTYEVRVDARKESDAGVTHEGVFRTAPSADQSRPIVFTVSTGQAFNDRDGDPGYNIYEPMLKLKPSFVVHTGDIVYYDQLAKNPALARHHWQRTYSLPSNVSFHRQVACYFIKDDHDTWVNDCWPSMDSPYMGDFTFAQGLAIFREQVPMGEKTYRTFRWGKDLQIWLVEGRDFRSPNTMPDGPNKTILGSDQMKWFQDGVAASDATFRVLISPTPVVGPDRDNKHDNHSNKDFAHEGSRLRKLLAAQKNMVVVCGDRHWQYHSIDPQTGLREYSCGPASNSHAGGWSQTDFRKDYHRYLNVIGGFLSATIDRINGKPTLTFRFHDDSGEVRYEHQLSVGGDGKLK